MFIGQIVRKPHDPGPGGSGGDGGVNPVAALILLLVCLLVVGPLVFGEWRKGERAMAAVVFAAPIVGIGLWLLVAALTN